MNAARRRCQASSVLTTGSSPRRRRQPPLAEPALAGLKNSVPDPHHHLHAYRPRGPSRRWSAGVLARCRSGISSDGALKPGNTLPSSPGHSLAGTDGHPAPSTTAQHPPTRRERQINPIWARPLPSMRHWRVRMGHEQAAESAPLLATSPFARHPRRRHGGCAGCGRPRFSRRCCCSSSCPG